ncbi:unnamed protein product [Rangifer tarandus platyrhynchus]|uniref:Uncharacterized protein n=1 Tax=Rangifer tarandus platyrhynchus TaxID=3082113 RepID=A0ABN8XJ48_RANTA|nr:unnamed protein product [Rangifer tarandus platyrhynchus]
MSVAALITRLQCYFVKLRAVQYAPPPPGPCALAVVAALHLNVWCQLPQQTDAEIHARHACVLQYHRLVVVVVVVVLLRKSGLSDIATLKACRSAQSADAGFQGSGEGQGYRPACLVRERFSHIANGSKADDSYPRINIQQVSSVHREGEYQIKCKRCNQYLDRSKGSLAG